MPGPAKHLECIISLNFYINPVKNSHYVLLPTGVRGRQRGKRFGLKQLQSMRPLSLC